LAKFIKKKTNLAKIKSCLNGSLDRRAVLSGPMAFDPIHLYKYFHICIYFIHQVIACFSKHAARAIATLHVTHHVTYHVIPPYLLGHMTKHVIKHNHVPIHGHMTAHALDVPPIC